MRRSQCPICDILGIKGTHSAKKCPSHNKASDKFSPRDIRKDWEDEIRDLSVNRTPLPSEAVNIFIKAMTVVLNRRLDYSEKYYGIMDRKHLKAQLFTMGCVRRICANSPEEIAKKIRAALETIETRLKAHRDAN